MLNKYIIKSCTCWLTEDTYDAIMALDEYDRLRLLLIEARETNDPDAWECYYNLYKDVWGTRPYFG